MFAGHCGFDLHSLVYWFISVKVINQPKLAVLPQTPTNICVLTPKFNGPFYLMSFRSWASAEDGRRFSSPHGPQHGDRSHTCTGKPHSHCWSNTVLISAVFPQLGEKVEDTRERMWRNILMVEARESSKRGWRRCREMGMMSWERATCVRKKYQTSFKKGGNEGDERAAVDML